MDILVEIETGRLPESAVVRGPGGTRESRNAKAAPVAWHNAGLGEAPILRAPHR